ncbi:hypothetical protein TWF481_003381 [Arthrobotrys musiformis]|uniref:F-box domain-containing protein n=1 Tax=Arthrobotrys musiformis TaxID=47236 RepID=A0AAV9VQ30_9PEZI
MDPGAETSLQAGMEAPEIEASCVDIAALRLEEPICLTDLPPELLGPICSYLKIEDLLRTMRTCKYLYAVGVTQLPKTINRKIRSIFSIIDTCFESRPGPAYRLYDLIKLDYRMHTHTNVGEEGDEEGLEVIASHRTQISLKAFLKLVRDQVEKSGVPRVQLLPHVTSLHGTRFHNERIYYAMLDVLRYYSYSRSDAEYAMEDIRCRAQPYIITRFFDLDKLRKINLSFEVGSWGNDGIVDPRVHGRYDTIPTSKSHTWENDYDDAICIPMPSTATAEDGTPLDRTLQTVLDLAELFRRTRNLKYLTLKIETEYHIFQPLVTIPSALKSLSDAVMGLKKLRTVRLESFLFHPGFFLPVPQTIVRLSLHNFQAYSKSWWMQFAKFPLPNLEGFVLRGPSGWPRKPGVSTHCGGYKFDTDGSLRDPLDVENMGFEIGDVPFEKLRYCKFADDRLFFLPRDLIPCILKKNKGIKEEDRKLLAESYGRALAEELKERWQRAAAKQQKQMEEELIQQTLEGDEHLHDLRSHLVDFSKKVTDYLEEASLEEPRAINSRYY